MKAILLLVCLLLLSKAANTQQTPQSTPQSTPQPTPQPPQQPPTDQIILTIGQIMPGQIDISKSKQAIHYFKVQQLQKKYLFFRINSFDKVRIAIGIYSNQTRQLIYACQDSQFDTCYVSATNLKSNTVYVALLVVNDNFKYNFYTYWADIEHLKPNYKTKFMFDQNNPTQLFHLEFDDVKDVQQIRILLKPQAQRIQGDNLKIFANVGFKGQPTVREHQISSVRVWGDSQAIILNKEKFQGEPGMALFIVGNTQTVYTLEAQFLKNTTHSMHVGQVVNDYLPQKKTAIYKLNFQGLKQTDTFVIKISSFNGQMTPSFFYNQQLTQPFQQDSYQYMSDIQYNLMKYQLKPNTSTLYLQIKSYDLQTTYQISTQIRQTILAYQMSQNVFQFTMISPGLKQAMYFYSHLWDSSQYQKLKVLKFDISSIIINGNPIVNYYYCVAEVEDKECLKIKDGEWKGRVVEIKPLSMQEVGSKYITTLQVNQDLYKKINNVQKRLMIIITLNSQGQIPSSIALQYSNPNQVRLLRQGRAFQDKVRDKEFKHYKYINNNPKISQIRIHINQISGLTKTRVKRINMLDHTINDTSLQYQYDINIPDTIVIKDKITQPVYVEVFGFVNSLYTISVTVVHFQHLVSNSLIMAEDIQYEVKLLPFQHMNVEIHPIEDTVRFQFYAEGGMIMACEVDSRDLCLDQKTVASQGSIKIDAKNKRQVRIRLGNYIDSSSFTPNSNTTNTSNTSLPATINKIKLTLIYHSAGMAHCQQRRVNKVYAQNIYSGSCYRFHIPLSADLDIMAVRSDLGPVSHMFILCGKRVVPSQINDRFVVKKEHIQENCKKSLENIQLQMVVSDDMLKDQVKLQYSVEYKSDVVTLLDGVAYTAKGLSTPQTSLRNFFYQIMDQDRDINILLYNKKGQQKFYATIVNKTQKYFGSVTESSAKFNSKSSNYYTNPYIKINASEISTYNCGRICVLSLSVYSTQKSGNQFQYALEITQNHVLLKEDHIKEDFLVKGSVRFYQFQAKVGKGSVVFKVSDNNRKCSRVIMSKNPFPTASNYYVKENEGTLVYQKTQKGTLYFAVEAIQDCPHTVSISQSQSSITKIEYGQYYDIQLPQGKQKFFYTRHLTNSTFKIISLKQHGQLQIFANRTQLTKQLLQSLQTLQLNPQNFTFKSSYKNTLVISNNDKQFCYNCYYLICIKANKLTSSSIFLGSVNSKININQKKIVFDQILEKGVVTYGTFYKVGSGVLLVKVHSGVVNFQIGYQNQKFSKQFQQNKKVYHQFYNFTKQQSKYQPLQFRISAQQVPALYSFELQPSSTSVQYENKITPGQHTFLYIEKGKTQCFVGNIARLEDQIYISSDVGEKYGLAELGIVVKVDGEITVAYQKEIVGNIMSIRLKSQETFFQKSKKYNVCLTAQTKNTSLSLYVFQSQSINLIHSDTQILVRKQARYVLYPFHDIILDLFQCKGQAQLYYSQSLQTLRQKQSHKLDVIGIPGQSHAIRISSYSTIYLEVLAQMATVLWMPLIQSQERGVGYFKYAIGGLEYVSHFNSLEFKIGGVYRAKETKTKPVSVRYTLFITNSKQILQEAVMCQKSTPQKLLSITYTTTQIGSSPNHTIPITTDKQKITQIFSQNETLYWNIVADLTLQPPNSSTNTYEQDHQHYRFIYYQQVVPSEVFRQNKLQSMQLVLGIVLIIVFVVGVVIVGCVFVRLVVPAIGRLRNRVLVEEKDDPKDRSIPLPPSSDRNQIQNNVPSTQDQMK